MLRITLGLAAWTVAIWSNRIWNIANSSEMESLFWPILFLGSTALLLVALYLWSENLLKSMLFALLVSAFGILSISRWGWSLTNAWLEENTLAFRLVHVLLAGVTLILSTRAAQLIWRITLGERKLTEIAGG